MEDFREKRLPDHLLSMLRKKGDKKKRITSVSYHLSSDGLPFYSYPCCREAGHPVIFFLRWGKIISQYPAVQLRIPV